MTLRPEDALVRFGLVRYCATDGAPTLGVFSEGRVHRLDLDELGVADAHEVFARWGEIEEAVRAVPTASEGVALDEVELLAPVAPRQLLQTGANYRTHVIGLVVGHRSPDDPRPVEQVREEAAAMMDRRAAHGEPYFFIGLPQTVVAADSDLVLPAASDKHDWELELAVVIGTEAFRVAPEDALDHVWGYTIVNDVSTRDLIFRKDMPEIGTDWFRAKNSPGFNPTGPFAVPASEFADGPFELRLDLNGETMQDADTGDLLFDIPRLISAASQTIPLLPGDLLLTGSPAGNGQARGIFLSAGDVVEGSITGLGTQRFRCVAEETR
ncbi:2-keto-4-pentenoate hydratase/2-oxohepta-3-ene-1,7-dioic acid hydratase (catechol pathway) [Rathayibacter oskolensis]|uniref:2-keto-4-pentenoate hydratase/2-oxohepta-3-ene-1,7-dioic acid hydratase (Catechol pathway) n=1 Tax=Rathayibacter oskolensis TaxID=1891671 RepID=A0A1X7NVQ1_9MICO|nr:fumarylacetoacetate hydrolase family protein [Rathayibacter oskolensis]SMH42413.1 2-keto-4-pentenoate hydratase/2-oxohepta-3-ene-1,7-dioic acid hydratase (catechol pathway) [Rathayibacter oskolensis]